MRSWSGEDKVVAVHGLLAGARKHGPHVRRLEALHPPKLFGGVVRDALPDRTPAIRRRGDVDRIARLEIPLDADHTDGQQARALLPKSTLRALVHEHAAAGRLRILEPELEARLAPRLRVEAGADRLARDGPLEGTRLGPVADHDRDARRGRHLGREHLASHAPRAEV